MGREFALAEGCRTLVEDDDITIFIDSGGVERAVFRVDENQDPLSHCDPNSFGYALLLVNFIDTSEGVAICEVMNVRELVDYGRDFSAEVMRNL